MDFLRICGFSIIYMCFAIFVKVRKGKGREGSEVDGEKGREKGREKGKAYGIVSVVTVDRSIRVKY